MSSSHKPGPAEILRAGQKDKDFIERIQQELTELVQQTLGQRFWLQWRNWLQYSSNLIYYSLTTLSGFQTLGEEYTGIVQVDSSLRRIPSKKRIAMMILLQTFGKVLLDQLLRRAKAVEEHRTKVTTHTNPPGQIMQGNNWIRQLAESISTAIPFLTQFHLTLFFFSGTFYHLSKRLAGIHYILVRKWFGNETQQRFKYIMWLSVFNLFLTLFRDAMNTIAARRENSSSDENMKNEKNNGEMSKGVEEHEDLVGKKCSLCLEVRRNPSVTPCGHLFCWDCILDWLSTKHECPICRDIVTPSRVVPLQNYK